MNTQTVRTAPRSPWQNAYVARVIGSIRRECLDYVIVMNAAGLHRVLLDYVMYYCVHGHTWRSTRTRRARVRSHRRQPVASLPFRNSVVCITVSTASPRSRCTVNHATADRTPVRSACLRGSELLQMSAIFRALVGRRRGLAPALEASKWKCPLSFQLFSRHRVLGQLKSARAKCGSAVSKALEGIRDHSAARHDPQHGRSVRVGDPTGPASGQKPIRR